MSTSSGPVPAAPAGGDRRHRKNKAMIAVLAITQTIGYGTLYYAFAVFLGPLAADLHTSATVVTGAFTASVLTSAALAIPVGRRLDRHGGRALMTGGSLLGVVLLVAFSGVQEVWQLYAVQIGIGVASAASLYEAAFAVIIAGVSAARRSAALLAVTVVAGFASTVFLPLAGWLTAAHGWRTALLVLAAVQAITVPLHALATPRRAPRTDKAAGGTGEPRPSSRPVVRAALADRDFWLLALGFTAHTAAVSTFTVHVVAALVGWGHRPDFAAAVAGLIGVLSVAGRLITTGLQRRYRTASVTAAVFAVQAAAALTLPVVGALTAGAAGAVIGFGLGFGVATIAKPVLLAERYDTTRYATLAGIIVVPATLAKAVAPLAAAALYAATGGYTAVFTAVAVCCAVAATAIAALRRGAPQAASDAALTDGRVGARRWPVLELGLASDTQVQTYRRVMTTTEGQAWVPDACTLPTAEQPLRQAEFDDLFATALRGQQRLSPTTLRWVIDPAAESTARDLTDRESSCCAFFTFTFRQDGAGLRLDVEVPAAHVAVLDALASRAAPWTRS
ncbi:MFS transporter [Catenuloplanes japonicus]|uniref:MFS transporter n=1 Tax=Catenuloplanes japonicus TaxID=33876 RepID=UPI000A5E70BE|nr:MFS transporter [Catenuloplanes japonicus]